jgi:hypothetical protein
LAVQEDNVGDMLKAIKSLADTSLSMDSQFEGYRRDFSTLALSEQLNGFLIKCIDNS